MKNIPLAILIALLACLGIAKAADIFAEIPGASQKVQFSCSPSCAATAVGAQFGAQTAYVRVVLSGATGFIAFPVSGAVGIPTSATGIYMPTEFPQFFKVPRSGKMYIIAHSATGTAYVTELSQ